MPYKCSVSDSCLVLSVHIGCLLTESSILFVCLSLYFVLTVVLVCAELLIVCATVWTECFGPL